MKIKAQANKNNASIGELYVYGDIADTRFWSDDVSPNLVREQAKNLPEDMQELHLYLNSYGGSVSAGTAIKAELDRLRQKTGCKLITYNDGACASMATVLYMMGDERHMMDGAMFLIHYPLTAVWGNSFEMEKTIEMLKAKNEEFVNLYMQSYTGDEESLRQLLKDEVWLTAKQTEEMGFTTHIDGELKVSACANGWKFGEQFVPKAMMAKVDGLPEPVAEKQTEPAAQEPAAQAPAMDEKTKKFMAQLADVGITAETVGTVSDWKEKASIYDSMLKAAVDEAIKNGVRAMGTTFDENLHRKALSVMNLQEVNAWSAQMQAKAEESLNAGKRVSFYEGSKKFENFNVEQYKI